MTNESSGSEQGVTVPSKHASEHLRGFEKFAVPLCSAISTKLWLKDLTQTYVQHINARWTYGCVGNLIEEHGLEHVRDLKPPGSVLLVANHRSFFDMYIASAVLYRHASFLKRIYFPVRSDFFYSHPVGLGLNIGISGGAMWPPIFRDRRRAKLNPTSMAQIDQLLRQPETLVGIHPEASRNKNEDPYSFLRTRSGIGQVVQNCPANTTIIPYFMHGLSSNFLFEVQRNFGLAPGGRGDPIHISFGKPFLASTLDQDASQRDLAEQLMSTIKELAEQDRSREHGSPEASHAA